MFYKRKRAIVFIIDKISLHIDNPFIVSVLMAIEYVEGSLFRSTLDIKNIF
ncbi:MAG TPA: hypothetical protein VJ697_05560 [Nitrososphaeraceae archaeon]|nr:hypothetical protein [Nitrososphaeraceae archaeon]